MKTSLFTKLILSMTFVMLFSGSIFAQSMLIIGDETIQTNYPPNTQVFDYGWATMMYSSAEVGDAISISKIAFDQTTDYAGYWEYAVLENQKVYIKQVPESAFSTLAYEDPDNSANGYTLVFDGTVQYNLSWTEIILNSNFDYDGTSSLIIHWENHRGTSAPIINVKFNASTVTSTVFKTLGGDGAFPTSFGTYVMERPNIALYYEGGGANTPVNPTPANNSYKGLIDTDLEFIIGDNTDTYDVYFGTDNPPTNIIVADAPVSAPGTFDCNPADISGDLLDSHTRYYWKVIAKNASTTAESQVWTFLTQGVIEDFPYFTSFEDQPINPLYADTIDWSWPISGPINWTMYEGDAYSGDYSVSCNVWSDVTDSYSLVSPRINLPTNQRASFWWKQYNGDGNSINVFFDISDDGGNTWETLEQFYVSEPMTEYDQLIVDLFSYAGNNVHFRWRYETLGAYVADYFQIDNLEIYDAPDGAVIQIEEPLIEFIPLAVGGETYMPLEVTNIGTVDLEITGSDISAPYTFVNPAPIAPGQTAVIDIVMNATTQGTQNQTFELTGNFTGDAEVNLMGSVYQVAYNFFNNADVNNEHPENWNVIRTNDPTDLYTDITVVTTSYDAFSEPNAIKIQKMNDIVSPLMLITEGVGGYDVNRLQFYAKKSYDSYTATLEVGLTDDPLHGEAFVMVESFDMTTDYQMYEVEFPANTIMPYIVFSFPDGEYAATIWLDDVEWDSQGNYPPYCAELTFPMDEAIDVDVMMGLELNWSSGGGNPTGYKLSVGTNADANNIIEDVDLEYILAYDFPVEPAYGEEYFWKVTAYNTHGDATGCAINSFTIMGDPVVDVPFFEDFDGYDALGDRDYPLGWSIENTNNDNFPWDLISDIATPGMAHSTPNAMHMVFSLNQMDDYLFTPPINLVAGSDVELSFWYRTMGDSWVPNPIEKLKVFVGNDNTSIAMTTEIYDNNNLANQDWAQANLTFSVNTSGEYFLGFYGYSDPNQGILLIDDVGVDQIIAVNEIAENSLKLYPNPTDNDVRISSKEEILSLKVYDINARLVIENSVNSQETILNVAHLSKGMYTVSIETKQGSIKEKLIIR